MEKQCVNYHFVLTRAFPHSLQTQAPPDKIVSQDSHEFVGISQHRGTTYTFLSPSFYPVFNIYRLRRCRAKCLREISGERYTLRRKGSSAKEKLAKHRGA